MITWSASIVSSRSSITCREAHGSGSSISHMRPGALQQPAARSQPWWADTAWIRLRSSVRNRTS
ncbi:hypothetical protein DBP22_23005 [Streptomyces sp. CS207]|nr:hypothetical protein DBP22_23005 [Streptomyces sp. CS207]